MRNCREHQYSSRTEEKVQRKREEPISFIGSTQVLRRWSQIFICNILNNQCRCVFSTALKAINLISFNADVIHRVCHIRQWICHLRSFAKNKASLDCQEQTWCSVQTVYKIQETSMGCIWPIGSGTGEAWHTHLAAQLTGKRKPFSWMRAEAQPFAKPSINMFVF